MKKLLIALMMVIGSMIFAVELDMDLLKAIEKVESNGKLDAKGDYSKKTKEYRAIGCMQIWKTYVDDVNRIVGKKKYNYNDRYNRLKSFEMVAIYLNHYGKFYERKTGKTATYEILSRIHNGGPNGWKKESTIKYWNKVKKVLNK